MKTFFPRSFSARATRVLALTFALVTPFAAVQLAGCGGGGGGSSQSSTVTATFRLVDENGVASTGLVTLLQNGSVVISQQSTNNQVVFNIKPGTYDVVFQINGVTTRVTIVVADQGGQTFLLTSGIDTAPNLGITVSGTIRLNPTTGNVALCNDNSAPVTARVIVRVRDANGDQPIVSSTEKPKQTSNNIPANQRGTYIIGQVPGPGTYFVEVVSARGTTADPTPGQFTGRGPIFTITQGQSSVPGVNVCVNAGTFAVGDVP